MSVASTADPLLARLRKAQPLRPAAAPPPRPLKPREFELGTAEINGAVALDLETLIGDEGRLLVQGISGAGKSWTLRRILEQTAGKVQQVIIDPEGEFLSLTEAFGHLHVDCSRLDAAALTLLAQRVRQHRFSIVLDMAQLTRGLQMQAVAAVLHPLIECAREFWTPALVAVDEGQLFAPFGGQAAADSLTRKSAIDAVVDLVGRGRKRGLACVLATRRLARLSKSVASEFQNFLVGRNTLDLDVKRAAETIGWEMRKGFDRLPLLEPGNFVAVGPVFSSSPVVLKVGPVATRDIGAAPQLTPPPAIGADEARALAGVDALAAESAATPPAPERAAQGFLWTADDDAIIREGYAAEKPVREIMLALEAAGRPIRSPSQISGRAKMLGIGRRANLWTDAEDAVVIDGYRQGTKLAEIAAEVSALGRRTVTRQAVQMRAITLGITCDRVNFWSPEETKIALDVIKGGGTSSDAMHALKAAGYHRGDTALNKFRKKHGLQKPHARLWTEAAITRLRAIYAAGHGPKVAAQELGWPYGAVVGKACSLGITVSREWPNEDRARLFDGHEAGRRLIDIAKDLNRPYANVAAMAKRMGLRFKAGER